MNVSHAEPVTGLCSKLLCRLLPGKQTELERTSSAPWDLVRLFVVTCILLFSSYFFVFVLFKLECW